MIEEYYGSEAEQQEDYHFYKHHYKMRQKEGD